jgi:hypothetical protein
METERTNIMDWTDSNSTAVTAAFIVLVAIVALGGLTFAFSGSIHF